MEKLPFAAYRRVNTVKMAGIGCFGNLKNARGKPALTEHEWAASLWQMKLLEISVMTVVAFILVSCDEKKTTPKAVPVSLDGSMELRLMTFNVRYENDNETGRRAWGERILGIVKMLRVEAPDILGTQEGQHGQMADLWASLPEYDFHGYGRKDGEKRGEYAGIYFRKDRFEIDEEKSGMLWLSDTPEKVGSKTWGNSFPRVATWVNLTDRSSGKELWVINMHLDHRNQPSREKGVRLMAERLTKMNSQGDPVVWLGDFNATENNAAVAFLRGAPSSVSRVEGFAGLKETFDVLNAKERKRGTLHFWMSDPNRQWKVDHILVSKEAEVLGSGIVKSGEPYLSDHFPVTTRVRWE
ncbi:MAG: endonuclease/exonuclease/phosphatase family protein [Luteolibacter sp.]